MPPTEAPVCSREEASPRRFWKAANVNLYATKLPKACPTPVLTPRSIRTLKPEIGRKKRRTREVERRTAEVSMDALEPIRRDSHSTPGESRSWRPGEMRIVGRRSSWVTPKSE